MVFVAELEANDVRPIDPEEWADHYGDDIIYSNVPLYKSEADRRSGQNPLKMMDWDADQDIATLTPGRDLPTDRSGSVVFTDGMAPRTRDGVRWMFTIPEPLLTRIATMRNHRLTVIREANNREPPRTEW